MRKNMRKFVAVVATLMTTAMMLAACGNKYDDTSIDVSKIDVDKYVGTVGDYSHMEINTDAKMEISDENVDEYINYVLSSLGTTNVEVDRAAESGDVVNIDFEGFRNGEAFQGGDSKAYDLELGSGTFIPGFEDGLIGSKAGDYVELNLTVPENYQTSSLAGQDVVFKVTVNKVQEKQAMPLSDDVIAKFGISGVNTVSEFKAYVKNSMEMTANNTYINTKRDAVLKKLYETSEFLTDDVPENLLNYYITQTQLTDQNNATQYGVSLEDYVAGYYSMTIDDYNAQSRATALEMAKDALLCEKIARAEGIEISDEAIAKQMEIDAANYGYESVDQFKEAMDGDDYKNYLVEVMVVDKILETATVTETPVSATE